MNTYTVEYYGFVFHFKSERQAFKFQSEVDSGKTIYKMTTKFENIFKNVYSFNTYLFSIFRLYDQIANRYKPYFHIECIGDGTVWENLEEIEFVINVNKKLPI